GHQDLRETQMLGSETHDEPRPDQDEDADGPRRKKKQVAQLGDFILLQKLGEGAMGVVYKARQESLDRVVAIKVMAKHLAKNPIFVQRFHREARVMAKLDHPHILHCYAVGETHG